MMRNGLVFIALACAFVFLGCSSPKPDDLVKESIRQWEEAARILEGVTDEAGLVEASRQLDALAQKMVETNKRFAALKVKEDEGRALEFDNGKDSAAALARFNQAAKRVKSIPGGDTTIGRFQRQASRTF